jgi:hypothetical protein
MPTLFCFGLGYSASHTIAAFGARFDRIAGTVTTCEKAAAIAAAGIGGHAVEAFMFDGSEAPPQISDALMDATALLLSVPPRENGDPVLAQFSDTIRGAPNLESSISRPSASMAVTAAHGSTRRRLQHPFRSAAASALRPNRRGLRSPCAPGSRSRSCGCQGFMDRASTR